MDNSGLSPPRGPPGQGRLLGHRLLAAVALDDQHGDVVALVHPPLEAEHVSEHLPEGHVLEVDGDQVRAYGGRPGRAAESAPSGRAYPFTISFTVSVTDSTEGINSE